uniref:SHSP domain-containing protein n=2 Tax=Auxenochlorella protothecoides TaxID=3075 RepID=A0A1D1ZXZ3_AUXPR
MSMVAIPNAMTTVRPSAASARPSRAASRLVVARGCGPGYRSQGSPRNWSYGQPGSYGASCSPRFWGPSMGMGIGLEGAFRDFEKIMNAFKETEVPTERAAFRLPIDLQQEDKRITISADLPGLKKSDVKVEVSPEGVLTITAERKEEAGQRSSRSFGERFRGRFRRSVRLPKSAAPEGITAKLEDGVLTLVVPKLETESPENRIINIGDDSGPASMEFPPSPAE